jgi:hypothetical protein
VTPIAYSLGVSSPLRFDKRAKAAQQVLNGGNVFGRDFLQGAVDGVFGEETGRACIRAKYWLGYADKELAPTYGPALDGFLNGLEQPSAAMVVRARKREAAAKLKPLREKALTEARKHIGVKESPAGSNNVLFGRWYGLVGGTPPRGQPWCAAFVTYCYVLGAKSKAFVKGSRYAYVPYIVADARAGRNGLQVTREPKPGDVVTFDWDGGVADHVGLFQHWLPGAEGSEFLTIEGNTSTSDNSNGGEVMERHRTIAQVEAFVRVGR